MNSIKLNSYSNASVFLSLCRMRISVFEVKSILPIDRYQNATSKAISQHGLKKVQLQEWYTLMTQDSIGHLKTLCMSVLSLVVALESEWKRYSSSQSDKKTLAFEYEFSFILRLFNFKLVVVSVRPRSQQSLCLHTSTSLLLILWGYVKALVLKVHGPIFQDLVFCFIWRTITPKM